MSNTEQKFKRKLEGVVVSDKNKDTIVVNVVRRMNHPTYNKIISRAKKYHAHDEGYSAKVGDVVTIMESRPYSKLEKWILVK